MNDDKLDDLIELIHSIKGRSVLWKQSRTSTSAGKRKNAWNEVAAENDIDVGAAKRKWDELIHSLHSLATHKEYPNPEDTLWSVLTHMRFLPEADQLLKSTDIDDFENIDQNIYVGDEHQASAKKKKPNFEKPQLPNLVKMTSRRENTAPPKIFKLEAAGPSNHTKDRSGSENENVTALKQLETVCGRFADAEFGYGMHVAQQLRELPMQNRETVRQKINTLLYDEIILGAGNNSRRTKI